MSRGLINKQFLSRTIVGVGGHNRRQEEAACWQQLEASRAGPSQHRSRSPSPAGAPPAKRARCGGRGSELDVRVAAQPFTASYHVDEDRVARPAACAGARAEPVERGPRLLVRQEAAQASGAGARPTEVQEQRAYWAQRKSRAALHPDKAAEDGTESEDSNAKTGKKPKKPKKDHKERKRSKDRKRKKSKRHPMIK